MSTESISTGSFSLSSGFYRITPRNYDVEFLDVNDNRRGCLLQKDCIYFVHLSSEVVLGELKSTGSAPENSVTDFVKISPYYFRALLFFAGARRNVMQRFGRDDRLLAFSKNKSALARAASKNVEYRYLRLYGLEDGSIERNNWKWMQDGWPVKAFDKSTHLVDPSILEKACVYVHIHYWETWPEIEAVLLNDCRGIDLILTSTTPRHEEFQSITGKFPNCRITIVENRGRDVGPFMELLHAGVFDEYEAVCKIHGKLSKKNGEETLTGVRIRRYILASLLANGACRKNYQGFIEDPMIGIAGPGNLLLPPSSESVTHYIHTELSHINSVISRSGRPLLTDEIEFFAGTMFWFRPKALETLRSTHISLFDFDTENGAKRNTLQHALERLFCLFAKDAGYTVKKLQPLTMDSIKSTSGIDAHDSN